MNKQKREAIEEKKDKWKREHKPEAKWVTVVSLFLFAIMIIFCIYGAASDDIDKIYIEKMEELGRKMAKRGHTLVFGGGKTGLMGACARGMFEEKGNYILFAVAEDPAVIRDAFLEAL